jgi:hypothetical protein
MKRTAHPLILLLGLALALSSARAQDAFMVMSVKGKVEYTSGKSGKWKKLEVGQNLKKDDVVRTAFASYAKLMHNAERLLSIDENTTKALAEFVKAKGAGSGESAAGKILQYAASQMSKNKEKRSGHDFGAVRGDATVFSAVFPTQAILTEAPTFWWIDSDSAAAYEVLVLDEAFKVIDKRQVNGFRLAKDQPALARGKTYHWQLTRASDGEIANVQSFTILAADTAELIRKEVESLDRELKAMNADDVTHHLIRAIYYERRSLYEDAFREYRETIRLAPGVEEYRDMMRNLLVTLRLYGEEDYLLR